MAYIPAGVSKYNDSENKYQKRRKVLFDAICQRMRESRVAPGNQFIKIILVGSSIKRFV